MTTQNPPSTIEAKCHCGIVSIIAPRTSEPMYECPCSVCYRWGVMWAYYPMSEAFSHVKISINNVNVDDSTRGKASSSLYSTTRKYSWGKQKIEFHACPRCHGLMYYYPSAEGSYPQMAINARMVLNREQALKGVEITPPHDDDKSEW